MQRPTFPKPPKRRRTSIYLQIHLPFRCTADLSPGVPCSREAEYQHPLTGRYVCLEHWPPYAQQFG